VAQPSWRITWIGPIYSSTIKRRKQGITWLFDQN